MQRKPSRLLWITILTLVFVPIGCTGFVGSIMGDCRSDITPAECSDSKSKALRSTMWPIGLAYTILFATIVLPGSRRD